MSIKQNLKDRLKAYSKKSPFLHSANHVLADELCKNFNEPKRFGFYLKMAIKYDHNKLRRIAGQALEKNVRNPGALFTYLISGMNGKTGSRKAIKKPRRTNTTNDTSSDKIS